MVETDQTGNELDSAVENLFDALMNVRIVQQRRGDRGDIDELLESIAEGGDWKHRVDDTPQLRMALKHLNNAAESIESEMVTREDN